MSVSGANGPLWSEWTSLERVSQSLVPFLGSVHRTVHESWQRDLAKLDVAFRDIPKSGHLHPKATAGGVSV